MDKDKLKDGNYVARQRISNNKVFVSIKKGVIKVNNSRIISADTLNCFYDTIIPYTKDKALYDIVWMVGGVAKETHTMRASYPVCVHTVDKMSKSTHKVGKLIIIKHTNGHT